MNIALFDTWNGKFSGAIREHWEKNGHKVVVNAPYDVMEEADITFFYQADNCAIEGVQKPHKGKIFVQAVDIEAWAGQASAVDWTRVDGAIFMADHIKEMVDVGDISWKIIKPGIDLTKWKLTGNPSSDDKVIKLVYIVGDRRIWDVKRLDIAFQILKDLMTMKPSFTWQLHIRGTYSSHAQYNAYCKYLEEDLGIEENVFWYEERIEDMNQWLEDKDFFLLPSTKEAFSYATAETMAKGIKPILNNWQGSKKTWGNYVSDTYMGMIEQVINGQYNPLEYRQYIEDNYDQERYFKELDEFMGIKGGE